MYKLLTSTILFFISSALLFGQSPIVRVKQIGSWDTPKLWWKDQETQQLQTFLAEDDSTPAYKNNNFDIWRDKVIEIEVTLDDVGQHITAFRFDIAFDNDIYTWVESGETNIDAWEEGHSYVDFGSHISAWNEGDETESNTNGTTDYSFEVAYYTDIGYTDSIESKKKEGLLDLPN